MGALLALVPIKDWIYCGIIVALLSGFAWYTHHERAVGANEALAPVAGLAQKAQVKVATAAAVATSTESQNDQKYLAALAAPVVIHAPVLVCHSDTGSGQVPAPGAGGATGAGNAGTNDPAAATFNPVPAVLEIGRSADAQIAYLQGRVLELEAQMNSAP